MYVTNWKVFVRALVLYAAGAWALVEVVDFGVSQYGLSRWLLDGAVLVAFGGGMITAVLAWFHNEPDKKKITRLEMGIVVALILAISAGVFYLGSRGPTADFDRIDGYRLAFEFNQSAFKGGTSNQASFILGQTKGIVVVDDSHFFSLDAPKVGITGTNIEVQGWDIPVMYRGKEYEEWVTITFVLPFEPVELKALDKDGLRHDQLNIDLRALKVGISAAYEITKNERGATIRLKQS